MLICMFAQGDTGGMEWSPPDPGTLDLGGKGIRDEEVAASAPLVRALVVQRLEQVWRSCSPHIDGAAGKPDPRFIEAGIRVLDRLAKLYRLDSPVPGAEHTDTDLIPASELVIAGLLELEQRQRDAVA